MSSYMSYLSPASWTRAQKNKADLEATNPTNPVLNDEDERFLERIATEEGPAPPLPERKAQGVEAGVVSDEGEVKGANEEDKDEAAAKIGGDVEGKEEKKTESVSRDVDEDMAVADDKPSIEPTVIEDEAQEGKADLETSDVVDGMAVSSDKPSVDTSAAGEDSAATQDSTEEKTTGEDGASDTKDDTTKSADDKADEKEDKMTKSWASYLPSIPSIPSIPKLTKKKDATSAESSTDKKDDEETEDQKAEEASQSPTEHPESPKARKAKKDPFPTQEEAEATTSTGIKQAEAASSTSPSIPQGRTTEDVSNPAANRAWSSYIPSLSRSTPQEATAASLAAAVKEGKKAEQAQTPAKNPDGSQTDDEKEVSVLLDKLNLSAINNRVFSFSKDSQKVYESFTVVLKDIVNGGPTAYEDLEKLIKENEGHLDNMFGNMPPFVQSLVKSLPTKVMSSLGPEVLAAMSEKPGADMQAKMNAQASSSSASASASGSGINLDVNTKKKQKRGKIPSAKALVSEQGAVASMLKSILSFLKLRFPAFVTGTNVLMSLAVFILLFVFWYCHKRGKEVRLLAEAEKTSADVSEVSDSESETEKEASAIPEADVDTWIKEKEQEKEEEHEKKVAATESDAPAPEGDAQKEEEEDEEAVIEDTTEIEPLVPETKETKEAIAE